MRAEHDIEQVIDLYADMVLRICYCYLKTHADREDVFEDVFIKYYKTDKVFENEEHRKAWLIRTAFSVCKDYLRRNFWKNKQSMDNLSLELSSLEHKHHEVLEAVLLLPKKYKEVIYMHYYEGYTGVEIAKILNIKENTVYSLLKRGRDLLKENLGGEWNE